MLFGKVILIAHGVLSLRVIVAAPISRRPAVEYTDRSPVMHARRGAARAGSTARFGRRARELQAKAAIGTRPSRKEKAVNSASPEGQRIEAHLRRRSAELWTDIRRELEKHGGQKYADLVQGAGDFEDDATADVLIHLNLSEIDRDAEELRAIQRALARLKRGEYGYCERCGEAISPGRLEAIPHATLCIECQTRAERAQAPDSTPSL
jgi:DnaK suppressor protein